MLACYIRCPFVSKYVLHIHIQIYESDILGQGRETWSAKQKMVHNAEKFLYSLWKRRLYITFEAATL